MIRSSLNLIVLLITWITIFSLTSSVSGLGIFTHNETKSYSNPPRMWQFGKYIDGTVVIRIINRDANATSPDGQVWVRNLLSLRIIHPNGTVSEIDKDLKIPEFNWHIATDSEGNFLDPISIFALHKGFILVRYFRASNETDYTTYEEWGRIIDWNGNLYSEVNFGEAWVENNVWDPTQTAIVTNVDPSKGFMRIAATIGTNAFYVEWQQHMIDDSFNLKKLSEGNFTIPQEGFTSVRINTIATVDEGYSVILGNSTNATNSNPLIYHAAVYDLTIGYNETQFSAPKLLYQIPLSNITIDDLFCGVSSNGVGQVCTLSVVQSNRTNSTNYYVRLNFLSSGSVTEVTPISRNLPELPSNTTTGWLVESIPFGGYLFLGYFQNADGNTNAYAYYFDELSTEPEKWELPEPSILNVKGMLFTLPNNTMLVSQIEDVDTWSFLTTDIPKYSENSDNGYSNILVKSTYPSINDIIEPTKDTSNIAITYYEPVELSDGFIWIYQISNNSVKDIVRQYVNGKNQEYCTISDDGLTVTVKVIRSAFSNPYSQFYVKVDNNFVKSKLYGEPLIGVSENIWKFKTNSTYETFAASTSGVMRLTTNGTNHYKSLNSTGQANFFHNLQTELSEIIPINSKRLNSNQKTQVDNSISPDHPIFISLNIESSQDERSVQSIINDLKDMIRHKGITSIGLSPTTNYLDEDFGFETRQNLWEKYKLRFFGVILALGILVVLFLIAQKKESKGRNMAVLQLGLIIFDFVMDTLFVSNNGKVVEVLYIPSVIFLTVPIVVNTVWAFYIIIEESKPGNYNTRSDSKYESFFDWFSQHGKVASIFTVLAGADIEALSILYSKCAGFDFFKAPFSNRGKERIFWGSCLNIFLEDIPQVIIQILYQQSVVTYDIIPLLALVSSCLNLLINIIGRLYQAINLCRYGALEYESTQDQEEFGGLQPTGTERNFTSSESIDVKEEKEKNSERNNLVKRSSRGSFQEVIP